MIGTAAMLPFATSAAWSEATYTNTINGVKKINGLMITFF